MWGTFAPVEEDGFPAFQGDEAGLTMSPPGSPARNTPVMVPSQLSPFGLTVPRPGLDLESFTAKLTDIAKSNQKIVDAFEKGEEERKAKPGKENEVKALQEALDSGDLDLRTGIGQKFAAAMKSGGPMAEEYKNLKAPGQTMKLKRQFRLDWASKHMKAITTVTKSKLEDYQKVEEDWGTYECIENIVVKEGGKDSPAAWEAALNYATKAMALGGQWLHYNSFTNRTDILYIKKRNITSYRKAWTLYEESQQRSDAASSAAAPAAVAAVESEVEAETPAKLAAKAKGSKRGKDSHTQEPGLKKSTPESKHGAVLTRQSEAMRNAYNKVCTKQPTYANALDNDPSWAGISNDHNKKNVSDLYKVVCEKASEPFAVSFFSQDMVSLKRSFKDDMPAFWHKLRNLNEGLGDAVTALDSAHARLHKMYLASKA